MSLSLFLSLIRRPHVISFESAKRKYTVGPVHEWRAQQKMEEAAGLFHHTENIMVPWHFCDLCMIGIGPEHEHQHIYLYPVYREQVGPNGERKRMVQADMLCICESCASWRERDLPEWLCALGPWAWETNALLKEDHKEISPVPQDDGKLRAQLRAKALEHLEACGWYIVYLTALTFNISLRDFFRWIPLLLDKEEVRIQHTNKVGIRAIKNPGILLRRA